MDKLLIEGGVPLSGEVREGIEHEVLFSTQRFKQRGALYQPKALIHG